MTHLTLIDVLRFHQRESGEARRRAAHPRASYETRTAWEITADIHRELAEAVGQAIDAERKRATP